MNGLSQTNKKELTKQAGEGTLENNMKQLITDEAYTQLSSKFPKIVPIIAGVNIIEMIDDTTAIGAAVLSVSGKKLLVPVVYSEGVVDATTFIYSEDDDTLLALTKKVVSVVVASSPMLEGGVPEANSKQNFDIGDIHKLFVPPKTFSPKVASGTGGLLFAVLEQSDLLKTALAEKLKNDEYCEIFTNTYGEDATKFITETLLNKEASSLDNTESSVLYGKKAIMESEWLNKEAAMQEFAVNGFAISQGINVPTLSLEKIASVATRLKDITGDEAATTIDGRRNGVYTVYRLSDLKPMDLVLSKDLSSDSKSAPRVIYGPNVGGENAGVVEGNGVIGKQKNLSEFSSLEDFSSLKPNAEENTRFVILHGGEIFGHVSTYMMSEKVEKGLGRTTISIGNGSGVETLIVDKNSNSSPVKMGGTLYVGDANVKLLRRSESVPGSIVRVADLDGKTSSSNIVKLAHDGIEFIYKSATYSNPALVNELLNEGYDKQSIYTLLKVAAQEGSAEFSAVNAKLDMLGNIVMNLAGQVQQMTAVVSQGSGSPAEGEQGLAQLPEQAQAQGAAPAQEPAPQEASLAMQDPNSGIQTPEQQGAMAQDQAAQVQGDQQMLMQEPQQGEQPDVGGMNTAIDPQVLQTLADLKDSNVMDVGIISTIAASSEIGEVVSSYSGDIHAGASAIGRILLNAMVKKNTIIEQVGEPKYKQMINSLRSVFVKISDLYVDITRLQLESIGKMAD